MDDHGPFIDRSIGERAARARAVRIIKAEGDGPWSCGICHEVVLKLGRTKLDGMVHHKNEDPWDNRRSNLEVLHSSCHHSHHHKGKPKPPSVGEAARKMMTGVPRTAEQRATLSAATRQAWEDGKFANRKPRGS